MNRGRRRRIPAIMVSEAGGKPGAAQKGGAAMSTAVRRQSIVDHSGAGVTATPSTIHSANRAAFIMTSAHSRRVSASNLAASAVSRAYENTYKTEPEKQFSAAGVKRVLRDVMEGMLDGRQYDKESCKQLTSTMAEAIKKRVKELGYPRYKLVSHVAIGQADDTSIAFASRCVWNVNFDSFAEYTYKNASLFAVGIVYAIYCD